MKNQRYLALHSLNTLECFGCLELFLKYTNTCKDLNYCYHNKLDICNGFEWHYINQPPTHQISDLTWNQLYNYSEQIPRHKTFYIKLNEITPAVYD